MKNSLLSLLVICFFVSCSSDPPDNPTGGTKLVKVLEIESDDITDSTYFDRYEYDVNGRVSYIYGDDINVMMAHFYYNGNDTKPYKMDGVDGESTNFFDYSTDGKLTKDSITDISGFNYTVNRFLYPNASQVIVITEVRLTSNGSIQFYDVDTLGIDGNTNVVSRKSYWKDLSIGQMNLQGVSTYTYDNKISPLSRTNVGFLNKYKIVFESINSPHSFQSNNCTMVDWAEYYGGTSYTGVTTYTPSYYSNNYLKDFTGISSDDPSFTWKDVFYYE